jgi:hypothetical protein
MGSLRDADNYFPRFDFSRCERALPAAVFDFFDVRPSLNTLDAALAAFRLVTFFAIRIHLPPFYFPSPCFLAELIDQNQGRNSVPLHLGQGGKVSESPSV